MSPEMIRMIAVIRLQDARRMILTAQDDVGDLALSHSEWDAIHDRLIALECALDSYIQDLKKHPL